jgi:plastocyanin
MMRIRLALAAAVAALAVIVVPLAAADTHAAKAQSVTVTMREFKFAFSTKVIHPGLVTFHLVNKGKLRHDLKIAGKTSARIAPAKTGTLAVTLKKGKYPYLCTVLGHAAAGMKGVLTVA